MISPTRTGAFLLCLAIILATASVAGAQAFTRIACKVVGQDERPIKGALVTVTTPLIPSYHFSKKTNKRGQCIVNFADGTVVYDFKIEMDEYQTLTAEVQPSVGTIAERVFKLAPAGVTTASEAVLTEEEMERVRTGARKVRRYNDGVEAQKAGDLEGALAMFREAVELDPTFAPAFTGIATVAMEKGTFEEAAQAAEKAVALDPEDYYALLLRHDAYRNLGDEAKTAAAAKALQKAGNVGEAANRIFQEAVESFGGGNVEGAKARFRQALDLDPELVAAYSNLAQIYLKEGNAAQAATMADQVLARRPGDLAALKVRYDASRTLGDTVAARSALREVVAADPTWAATGLFEHAQELFNTSRIEEARTVLEEVVTARPDHPESRYLLGLCCNSTGDIEAAKEHFRKFLELAPDHAEAPTVRELLSYLQ